MSILHLTLHRQWFDEIAAGTKRIEYRADTPYWRKRLLRESFRDGGGNYRKFDEIHFRNGYHPQSPWMRVEHKVTTFGPGPYGNGFQIHLGAVLEVKNWRAA